MLGLRGDIPTFIQITDGKTHEVKILDELVFEPSALYVMDKGYLDFQRLFALDSALAYLSQGQKRISLISESIQPRSINKVVCDATRQSV